MSQGWMNIGRSMAVAVFALSACAFETGQIGDPESAKEPEPAAQQSIIDDLFGEGSTFPAVASFDLPGPFWTTSHAGGWDCTIWRPLVLGETGRPHPVIIWGNGTFNVPETYLFLFDHWASHGFIVAAANTSDAGSGQEMLACLDYLLTENVLPGVFGGMIDTNNIGVAGYSQGGCGALVAASERPFKAAAPISPFIVVPLGFCNTLAFTAQQAPMFLVSGGLDLVAQPTLNQLPIFAGAPVPIVWGNYSGSGHLEVLFDGGVYKGPLTAWFRAMLMNDPQAKHWFSADGCELCNSWGWDVQYNLAWALAAPF